MAAGYTYLYPLTESGDWQKYIFAGVVSALLVGIGGYVASRIRSKEARAKEIIPSPKISLLGFFDFFLESFVRYHDTVLGKENRHHIPFTATLFTFLLLANFLGLVPGMPAITTTVWVNVGIALVVFVYFNVVGIKAHGFWNYLKHFAGPVWWLAFFMFPLELLSTALRVFTLNLRLYWNISADHLVLGIFTDLLPPPFAFVFYGLGTFVSFMQAFIFTTLTMVYIRLASEHAEEGHH